jgi:L-asparaginase II
MSTIFTKVLRNGTLESVHRGSIIVVTGKGEIVGSVGSPSDVTFWRSAAKAFQAIPFLTSGAAEAFGFTDKDLALACASHSGEDFHAELALKMLHKAGFKEADLLCGAHAPFHEESAADLIRNGIEPGQRHNNCSGKHAAMLAYAKHIGADTKTYLTPENPVQVTILETISLFTGVPVDEIKTGTDGCSAPNFAIPLSAMARAFAKLANPTDDLDPKLQAACKRIVNAKMTFPEYVGGSVRLDTKVMRALKGKVISKVGAEGVWSVGVLPSKRWPDGLGIALKVDDGNDYRARPAVGIELLRKLDLMTPEAETTLGEFSPRKLINSKDIVVGEVIADFELE